jgi:1-acyl-sn-glycerol-3-phosphate acyltransferase
MESGMPVTAAYISYSLPEGSSATVGDAVCYWGDAKMLPHIFRFLGLRGVRAEVRFASEPIRFSSDVMHRKMAAIESRAAVAALGCHDGR